MGKSGIGGTALAVAILVFAGPALAGHSQRTPPNLGTERLVADTMPDDLVRRDTGQPPPDIELVGELGVATDSGAVAALADHVQVMATDLDLVGDSTFVAATASIGFGSSFAGIGFETSADGSDLVNPVLAPPTHFEGLVVIGVSVWDVGINDASAYRRAVETYRQAGYPVVVVEVPESYGHGPTPQSTIQQTAEFRALNAAVAEEVGCELEPWSLRDVETLADVDETKDYVHPSSAGVDQLLTNLSKLGAHHCQAPARG